MSADADKVLEVMAEAEDGRIESPKRCYWAPKG